MAKGSNVTEEQCESRHNNVHHRINDLSKELAEVKSTVSNIKGGIAVIAFVAILIFTGIMYHLNFRFGNIDKAIANLTTHIQAHIKTDTGKVAQPE